MQLRLPLKVGDFAATPYDCVVVIWTFAVRPRSCYLASHNNIIQLHTHKTEKHLLILLLMFSIVYVKQIAFCTN